jgi:hypothetical protein
MVVPAFPDVPAFWSWLSDRFGFQVVQAFLPFWLLSDSSAHCKKMISKKIKRTEQFGVHLL